MSRDWCVPRAVSSVFPTQTGKKHCGLVVVEKDSKLLLGSVVPNKTSAAIVPAMRHIAAHLFIDTCTFDNGSENVRHTESGVPTYFCDPGSPLAKAECRRINRSRAPVVPSQGY